MVSAENGMVKVRLSGACAGCPMSQYILVNMRTMGTETDDPEELCTFELTMFYITTVIYLEC